MAPTVRLTTHRLHLYINHLRGRAESDTSPTFYRANSQKDIKTLASKAGLTLEKAYFNEKRPEYLRMTWPTYLLGAIYERIVNPSDYLTNYRISFAGILKKST